MSFLDALKIAGAALASIGSASAIVWALSSWLGKVWASRILEQDRVKYAREIEQLKAEYGREIEGLKTELEKTVFVSRIQFETEFKALACSSMDLMRWKAIRLMNQCQKPRGDQET